MEAVQPIRKVQVKEHETSVMQDMIEVTVKDVWTKFFFNEQNLLCFQVLLQIDSGEIVLYQEFKDYSEYKNTWKDLLAVKSNSAVIKISEKSVIPVHAA